MAAGELEATTLFLRGWVCCFFSFFTVYCSGKVVATLVVADNWHSNYLFYFGYSEFLGNCDYGDIQKVSWYEIKVLFGLQLNARKGVWGHGQRTNYINFMFITVFHLIWQKGLPSQSECIRGVWTGLLIPGLISLSIALWFPYSGFGVAVCFS